MEEEEQKNQNPDIDDQRSGNGIEKTNRDGQPRVDVRSPQLRGVDESRG